MFENNRWYQLIGSMAKLLEESGKINLVFLYVTVSSFLHIFFRERIEKRKIISIYTWIMVRKFP